MAEEPPDAGIGAAGTLSAIERDLLQRLRTAAGPLDEDALQKQTGFTVESVRGTLERLRSKHLAVSEEERTEERRLTSRGESAMRQGLPERRLLDALASGTGAVDAEGLRALGLTDDEQRAAVGILRRHGYLVGGSPFRLRPESAPSTGALPEESAFQVIARGGSVTEGEWEGLRRRGLVERHRRIHRRWSVSAEGRAMPLPAPGEATVGAITPSMLRSGAWKSASFRPYDVRAVSPLVRGARPHPYVEWLSEFQEILVGLGFEQWEGPLLESEFWNNDVLFMPQEHPARSLHDALSVEGAKPQSPDSGLLERVAAVHEGRPLPGEKEPISFGWRTPYRTEIALRPVLRSQTTAVSARFMAAHPEAPFRVYAVDRNFRREELDASHLVEFDQCEGILGAPGTSMKELVGVFRAVAEAIGIRDVKFRPSYFPFTEPSIEGYVRHPRLGWMEIFPGGMFRPEVLRPLGVTVPVAAWGIGVTRLATVALGVSDIRDLYMDDLERLEGQT